MPHKILKSAIAGITGFEVAVAAHAKEMRDWRAQMRIAAEHKGNDNIPGIERYVERPMPRAHIIVESAVNENDEADFEIVDDGPTPDQILAAKKKVLVGLVTRAETAEIEKVFPEAKMRLIEYRKSDIAASDAAIIDLALRNVDAERNKLLSLTLQRDAIAVKINREKPGVIGSIVNAVTGPSKSSIADEAALNDLDQQVSDQAQAMKQAEAAWSDHAGLLAKARDPKDHAFMLDYEARRQSTETIRRWAAQTLSDVADLTAQTVDTWKLTPFQN